MIASTVALRWFALVFVGLFPSLRTSAERLTDVLAKRGVPLGALTSSERSRRITSYAESQSGAPLLIAYYEDEGTGLLKSPLHVLRYDNTLGLQRRDLSGADGPFAGVMHEPNSLCFGSVLEIQQSAGYIYIDTHINPSAGCVPVLSQDLEFKVALEGWVLGMMDHMIILHGNEVHFADTHPSTVAVYDIQADKLVEVYPPKEDPSRRVFAAALATRLPAEPWCAQANKACDPETFTSDISDVRADEQAQSFSFTATLSPEGFGEKAETGIETTATRYIFKLQNGKWVYTEHPLE